MAGNVVPRDRDGARNDRERSRGVAVPGPALARRELRAAGAERTNVATRLVRGIAEVTARRRWGGEDRGDTRRDRYGNRGRPQRRPIASRTREPTPLLPTA